MKRHTRTIVLIAAMIVVAQALAVVVSAGAATCPPTNDTVAGAVQIPTQDSLPWSDARDTCGAGPLRTPAATDTTEPHPTCAINGWGATVWYRWPARTQRADITLNTYNSTRGGEKLDTILQVYRVEGTQRVPIACNDDTEDTDAGVAGTRWSKVRFEAEPNREYLVQVGGITDFETGTAFTGNVRLNALPRPINDEFTKAIDLPVGTVDARNTIGATTEPNEPSPNCSPTVPVQASVWYSYTHNSTTARSLALDTLGSSFDTVVGIYDSARNPIACDDNYEGTSQTRMAFTPDKPGRYFFQVWGKNGATGNLLVRLNDAVSNDTRATAAAIAISDAYSGAQATGSSVGAATENPKPSCKAATATTGASVWHSITPTTSRPVTIDTLGSAFDTILAVYDASDAQLVCNDNAWPGTTASKVVLNAVGGTTYFIQVSTTSTRSGSDGLVGGGYVLNVPTSNNDVVRAQDVTTLPFIESGATARTIEGTGRERFLDGSGGLIGDEPTPSCLVGTTPADQSVWYKLQLPSTTAVTVHSHNATDGADTILTAYTVRPDGTPNTLVACNDDTPNATYAPDARIQFVAPAGTPILVRLASKATTGKLNIAFLTGPLCDTFAEAATGACSTSGSTPLSETRTVDQMAAAGFENGEPTPATPCVPAGKKLGSTLWFRYVATQTGIVSSHTVGSDYNTVINAYTGTALTSLALAGCNDDADGQQSRLQIPVTAGSTYYFQVGGIDEAFGALSFRLALRPGNDDRAFATTIAVPNPITIPLYAATQSTTGASIEPGEQGPRNSAGLDRCGTPTSATPFGATVWYKVTLPIASTLVADTAGSNYDNVLGIWSQPSPTSTELTPVGCNDGAGNSSRVSWDAVGGTTYFIQVAGIGSGDSSATGLLALQVRVDAPKHDAIENAKPVLLANGRDANGNLAYLDALPTYGATTVDGERTPTCASSINSSVWYLYVPGAKMKFDLLTTGSDHRVVAAIYHATALGTPGTQIECSADGATPGQARLRPTLAAGQAYYIQVAGVSGSAGKLNLRMYSSPTL